MDIEPKPRRERKRYKPGEPRPGPGRPRKTPLRAVAAPTPADGSQPDDRTVLGSPPSGDPKEWAGYGLLGRGAVIRQKRRLLAQLEGTYELGPAATLCGIPRYKVEDWLSEDDEFARAVDACREFCRQRAGSLMYQAGLTPTVTREGNVRVNAQALIMYLNAQDPDYGLMKKETIERRDARLVQRACELLEERLPAEEIERFRSDLGRVCLEEMLGTASRKKEG